MYGSNTIAERASLLAGPSGRAEASKSQQGDIAERVEAIRALGTDAAKPGLIFVTGQLPYILAAVRRAGGRQDQDQHDRRNPSQHYGRSCRRGNGPVEQPHSEGGGFEPCDEFLATVLEPRRKHQRRADRIGRLVPCKPTLDGPGHLEQRPARRTNIAGLELVAVLLIGDIGEAETFDMGLELQLVLFITGIERQMMDRATGQRPGALRASRLVQHLDHA